MINSTTPVALILPSQGELDLFTQTLNAMGYRCITRFTSGAEAYEVAIRQQFPLFVTRLELPDMNGIVLIQKLRATGNYGEEAHLIVCEKVEPSMIHTLYELELTHILSKPHNKQTIKEKFEDLVNKENRLTPLEMSYRQARSCFANSLVDMASDVVAKILEEMPNFDRALILMGDIYRQRNDIKNARASYQLAHKSNPKSATAAHRLAQCMMTEGLYKEAADVLNVLADLNPYNVRLLENTGLSNFGCEQYDKAKSVMASVTKLDEANKTAASVSAQIMIKEGNYNGVLDHLEKAMTQEEVVHFLNDAGIKLSKGNDVEGAIKMYSACLSRLQNSDMVYAIYYNMGVAYKRLKDFPQATACLKKCLELKPGFERASQALNDIPPQRAA